MVEPRTTVLLAESAAAAAAATTCVVSVVTATLPTKRKTQRYDLPEFCKDSAQVRLESL